MWSMMSDILLSVEHLYDTSCRHLRPLYIGSVYPVALMLPGLWCFGLSCFRRFVLGIMVGCLIFALSFWSPSCVAFMD